jgi:hypothetical protein
MATGDLGHPAAAVDVDEERPRFFGDPSGFGQPFRIRAVDLNPGQHVIRGELHFPLGVSASAQEAFDIHELRHRDGCAVLAAQPTKGHIGDVLHRGKYDGLLRIERVEAFSRREQGRPP